MEPATEIIKTVLLTCSIMSLMVGISPMLWGAVHVRLIVTSLTACVVFGLLGTLVTAGPVGLVMLAVILTSVATAIAGSWLARALRRPSRRAVSASADGEPSLLTPDGLSRSLLPEMLPDVQLAIGRIERFRRLAPEAAGIDVAETRVLVDRNLPDLLDRYAAASDGVDDDERRELARTTLGAVIDIGRRADEVRRRISAGRRAELETETRYITSKTAGGAEPLGPVA